MTPLWLASGSPRRRQLLEWAGMPVEVHPSDIDESWIESEPAAQAAERLARAKCLGPAERTVLSADTVVHLGDRPFGKPADATEAAQMLGELQGRWHQVTTGVALRRSASLTSFRVTTRVRFRALDRASIERYVASGEPFGKAGAYAIQGMGGVLIAEVQGSWTNVMGLPMERTLELL